MHLDLDCLEIMLQWLSTIAPNAFDFGPLIREWSAEARKELDKLQKQLVDYASE